MNEQEKTAFELEIRQKIADEERAKQRSYKAEWRKKNPDKVKAANERYWRNRVLRELEGVAKNGEQQD